MTDETASAPTTSQTIGILLFALAIGFAGFGLAVGIWPPKDLKNAKDAAAMWQHAEEVSETTIAKYANETGRARHALLGLASKCPAARRACAPLLTKGALTIFPCETAAEIADNTCAIALMQCPPHTPKSTFSNTTFTYYACHATDTGCVWTMPTTGSGTGGAPHFAISGGAGGGLTGPHSCIRTSP